MNCAVQYVNCRTVNGECVTELMRAHNGAKLVAEGSAEIAAVMITPAVEVGTAVMITPQLTRQRKCRRDTDRNGGTVTL